MGRTVAPYGSWESPITAGEVASRSRPADEAWLDGGSVWWREGRPLEEGRYVLVRAAPGEPPETVTPEGFNVRSRVHEYGGGSYVVGGGVAIFTNFADQRLYRQEPGSAPRPITPEPPAQAADRYADGRLTPDGRLLVCVRERHLPDGAVVNDLVTLPVDGSSPPRSVAGGRDFYAGPRIDPGGSRVAWLCWDFPNMPWDGCEVWVGDLTVDGGLANVRCVAGGADESIWQPEWSPGGVLHYASDRTGWWNLYRHGESGPVPLYPAEAEFGDALWTLGESSYGFLPDGRIVAAYVRDAFERLAVLEPGTGELADLDLPFAAFEYVRTAGNRVAFVGGGPTETRRVACLDLPSTEVHVLHRAVALDVDPSFVSSPKPVEFPTDGGLTAHALVYPPTNPAFEAPDGARPPLVVMAHGGPTSRVAPVLAAQIQYFTTRGFAVADVNYGGSTGYGRAYRDRLKGRWGIVDVTDCVNAAAWLAAQGEVDGARMAIRGGSAGGFVTLAAVTFHDVFSAGASYYGVGDLEALARDTHKFESHYLDLLVGPYPEAVATYRERSPVHSPDRIACPLILFQGTEDRVVPPAQAEDMARALAANGVPHALVLFEGEQHGFRRAETVVRSLEMELAFYGRVFGFRPAGDLPPLQIEGLDPDD